MTGIDLQNNKELRTRELGLVSISLAVLIFVLYRHAILNNFWMFDDLHILHFAVNHSFSDYFFNPQASKLFSSANFTPLSIFSYAVDHFFFGLSPKWYYIHQHISLLCLTILLYAISRFYAPVWAAFVGALFFVLSKPFAVATEILMFRHYIEGAVFSGLSILFYISALRKDSCPRAAIASFCYFLAVLSKEVYIPLVLVLLFLPEKTITTRFRMSLFFIPSVTIYFMWRYYILGSFIGGYSGQVLSSDPGTIFSTFFQIPGYLSAAIAGGSKAGAWVEAVLFSLPAAALTIQVLRKDYSGSALVIPWFAALVLPLMPISKHLSTEHLINFRFAFASAALFSIMAGLSFSIVIKYFTISTLKSKQKKTARISLPGIALAVLFSAVMLTHGFNVQYWIIQQRTSLINPLSAEGRFLWDNHEPGVLIRSTPSLGIHYYEKLDYFLNRQKQMPQKLVIAQKFGLLSRLDNALAEPVFYAYDPVKEEIGDISQLAEHKRREMLSRMKSHAFSVDLRVHRGHLDVRLETDNDNGRFILLMGYLPGIYCDGFAYPGRKEFVLSSNLTTGLTVYFRFGWESQRDGSISLSPEWRVDFAGSTSIAWPEKETPEQDEEARRREESPDYKKSGSIIK